MADILSNVLEDTNDNGWLQLQRVRVQYAQMVNQCDSSVYCYFVAIKEVVSLYHYVSDRYLLAVRICSRMQNDMDSTLPEPPIPVMTLSKSHFCQGKTLVSRLHFVGEVNIGK